MSNRTNSFSWVKSRGGPPLSYHLVRKSQNQNTPRLTPSLKTEETESHDYLYGMKPTDSRRLLETIPSHWRRTYSHY